MLFKLLFRKKVQKNVTNGNILTVHVRIHRDWGRQGVYFRCGLVICQPFLVHCRILFTWIRWWLWQILLTVCLLSFSGIRRLGVCSGQVWSLVFVFWSSNTYRRGYICSYSPTCGLFYGLWYSHQTNQIQTQTALVHAVLFKVQFNNNDIKTVLVTSLSSQLCDLDSPCRLFRCLAL